MNPADDLSELTTELARTVNDGASLETLRDRNEARTPRWCRCWPLGRKADD